MKIGSHVSMSGKEMLLGSVKEAVSYGANTFMFYTGAPQNTARKPVSQLRVEEAKEYMKEHHISIDDVVVHAPYIINLANTVKPETYELAVRFLKEEIARCEEIGVSRLVLHPGSHVKAGDEAGLKQIVKGLNEVLREDQKVHIALETMAGKGSEMGRTFDQIQYMIENTKHSSLLGVCLDTCHIHDAGYDLTHFDDILEEFDQKIGLDRLLVVHVNDSKNERGAHKDRHENIGYGYIGFETLNQIVHHPKLKDVPKILETPYIDGKAPYREEIEMFMHQTFNSGLK
ncbi:deoxyribonuclease IV [Massilimicrobiota timonensis]|uniref:deoxyribonuclease IV n=1 Tax=Massilimicrobiota timonensis TaxID=1776392 RepID=UPI0019D0B6DB|nr:deoxyribonuclease IV [Massilimicrobiota timonensis]